MTEVLMFPSSIFAGSRSCHHRDNLPQKSNTSIADTETSTSPLPKKKTPYSSFQNWSLPIDFEPGEFDVICSQGKKAKTHAGNIYFRSVIEKRANEYANSFGKKDKSRIVRDIIQTIQTKSPNGGFVKKAVVDDGRIVVAKGRCCLWKLVGTERAREKVSQSLRDTLAGHYRSSLVAKKRSRKESNLRKIVDFEELVASNRFVSARMRQLADTLRNHNNDTSGNNGRSGLQLLRLMTETNLDILRLFKHDEIVQRSVRLPASPKLRHGEEECKNESSSSFPPSCCAVDESLRRFQTDEKYLLQQPQKKRRKIIVEP